ncbi:preprotein translocase IISP family, auxillary membrane component [Salmonella enterica subsp. enterica serovar Choleraesuis str. SC-B67]|uniref:Protein-export membrane protein SecG n=9 Tax=Salmonella enterica TaxID=28901 RepID=Q57JH4_SALCH|nr:preprotein translocase IISP family, auxillary membrane component [Salmonella enterica subsp. enterica serovar Choleraesuis str. SC-B67]
MPPYGPQKTTLLLFFSAVDTMRLNCPCEGHSLWLVFTPASVGNSKNPALLVEALVRGNSARNRLIMYEALLVVFLIVAIGLVGLIMLQQGKGADMGASFGAGASATLFGSSGSGNFMTRMTAVLATLFFIISLVLGNINSNKTNKGSEWENLSAPAKTEQTQPAAPAQPASDIPR